MTTVFVLVHEHKHGTDLSVHRSRAGAARRAVAIAAETARRLEHSDLAARVADLSAGSALTAAIDLWQAEYGNAEGQALQIVPCPLRE